MKCPAILIYQYYDAQPRTDEAMTAAGRGMAFAAAMLSDGRPGTHWMATGRTADEAREKLEAMWRRQYPETNRGAHMRKKPVETVDASIDIVL